MILFNDCRLCKECSKVRNGAMRSDVQTKVSEDVIFGVFFANLMIWFCCFCWLWNVFSWRWYIYRTRSWNKDKYESPQELPLGPFKTWGLSSQSIPTFQASFTHYNLFVFFFSQSITGASIIPKCFFFFVGPPPTPEKALKTTDSPIFPGELSQFDMDALKSVPRKQGHSLYPRWISLNRKIWL